MAAPGRLARTARLKRHVKLLLAVAVPSGLFAAVAILQSRFDFERFDFLGVSVAVATVMATVAAVLAHRWSQKQATLDFMKDWNDPRFVKDCDLVERIRPGGLAPLPLKAITGSQRNQVAVMGVLNHLQKTCIGTEQKVFDDEIMYAMYGHTVVSYFVRLREFIEYVREKERQSAAAAGNGRLDGVEAWPSVDAVVDRWGARMYGDRWPAIRAGGLVAPALSPAPSAEPSREPAVPVN